MPRDIEIPIQDLVKSRDALNQLIEQSQGEQTAKMQAGITVGAVVYYRPIFTQEMKTSQVVEIIPTHPEPLVRLEDGKIMPIREVANFLPKSEEIPRLFVKDLDFQSLIVQAVREFNPQAGSAVPITLVRWCAMARKIAVFKDQIGEAGMHPSEEHMDRAQATIFGNILYKNRGKVLEVDGRRYKFTQIESRFSTFALELLPDPPSTSEKALKLIDVLLSEDEGVRQRFNEIIEGDAFYDDVRTAIVLIRDQRIEGAGDVMQGGAGGRAVQDFLSGDVSHELGDSKASTTAAA